MVKGRSGKGRNDSILRVIWTTIWIQAARCVYVQDKSKTYGWIFMKFSGNVLNGTKNK